MITPQEIADAEHWFGEVLMFMQANGLKPLAVVTAKSLPGGAYEMGAIENRMWRVPDDFLRAAFHHSCQALLDLRVTNAARRRIIMPGEGR